MTCDKCYQPLHDLVLFQEFLLSAVSFSKLTFFQKFILEYHQSVSLDPDPYLGTNCLQRLLGQIGV